MAAAAATTTQTSTTTPPIAGKPAAAPAPVRKSPLAATWHTKPPSEWNFWQRTLVDLSILQDPHGSKPAPVFPADAPVPYYPILTQHAWVFPRAILPLLVNWGYSKYTGHTVPNYVAGPIYLAYFLAYGSNLFAHLRRMTKTYGFFDGAKPRDGIPDVDVERVGLGLMGVITLRTIFAFTVLYPAIDQVNMLTLEWLVKLPFNLFMYALAIDFWFYWYHRLMHEVDWLWPFHRKHHTTKHPNAALGAYADHEQELGDMLGIPALAYLIWPVDFPTWWCSTMYTLYIEAGGHSGMRLHFGNPTAWPLYLFQDVLPRWGLILEDHDLHHRRGWKKSGNYGKQTRFWDWLFGSLQERQECTDDNVAWKAPAKCV